MFRRFSVNFALLSLGLDIALVCVALASADEIQRIGLPADETIFFCGKSSWIDA